MFILLTIVSSDVKLKTISMYVNNITHHRIFDFMTKISKNIYNSTIFCTNILIKYKSEIFKEIYLQIKNKQIPLIKIEIEKLFYNLYDTKYEHYILTSPIIKKNNEIIYKFIVNILKNQELVNDNYKIMRQIIIYNLLRNPNVSHDKNNKKEHVIDIIDNILKSIYTKNFYRLRNALINHKPFICENMNFTNQINNGKLFDNKLFTCKDKNFINQVKNNEYLFKNKKKIDWKNEINKKITEQLNKNNNIIHKFIIYIYILQNQELVNDNYEITRDIMIYNLLKNPNILYNENKKKEYIINIIDDILKSIYTKNFNRIKNALKNQKSVTCKDANFINQVKNNEYLFKNKNNIDLKRKKNKKKSSGKLNNNNLIGRIVYRHIDNDIDKLPSDIIINIIQKAYQGYLSFYALKNKGIKCNMPKYLDKNAHYNLLFFGHSMKIVEKDYKIYMRLTVGTYIAKNYNTIINNSMLICLNPDTDNKKYISYTKLYQRTKNILKTKNYILDDIVDNNNISISNKYIQKNNKNIVDAYYIYINIPHKILDKHIKLVEIKPIYENHKYKINIVYDNITRIKTINEINYKESIFINEINYEESISIDLGQKNLMTIYNPTGKQNIISGAYLNWLNQSYNYKIDHEKRKIKKINKKDTSKYIRNLLIERETKINDYLNKLVKWLEIEYSDKKIIVIGYNEQWKNKINMGKINNRKFYQIPYCKLLDKLTDKMLQKGILVKFTEESYTSKCDSLALEEIKRHKKYLGERISRGLFSSSKNKYINADLNGAINIMRKYYKNIKEIKGKSLYNPTRVNISSTKLELKPED